MTDIFKIWEDSLNEIKTLIGEAGYKAVFPYIKPLKIEDNIFYFTTSNSLYEGLFEFYRDIIRQVLYDNTKIMYDMKITVTENENQEEIKDVVIEEKKAEEHNTLKKKYTFENFIVGKNSEFAYAAAFAIAMGPGNPQRNPFFIYGGSGLGKTHLLHAVGNEILKNDPSKKVICLTAEQFCNNFIESIRYKTQAEFRQKYRNVDALLIDDIQFFAGKEGMQEEFFHTFEELVNDNKQIMLTCDRPAKDITPLEERLRTRLSSGITTEINPPDLETRIAIIHSKIENAGSDVEISDEILGLIAQTIKSNIRELEGAIRTIIAWKEIQKKEIDIDTASKILEDYFTSSHKRMIDADLIIKEVQKHFGLGDNTIVSKKKDKIYAYPRQVAMTICHELTKLSYTDIGKEFDRTHATVMHNINKMRKEMETNLDTYNMVQDLIKNIQNFNE